MLKDNIKSDQIKALKSGEKQRLEVLRYILSQIKNREIEKREDLSDEEILNVLRKIAKQLKESIESFEKGNREDLAKEYSAQFEIVSEYLPAEISDEELKTEINKIIKENSELHEKNPKAIIGIAMKTLKDKADPSRIMKILNSL